MEETRLAKLWGRAGLVCWHERSKPISVCNISLDINLAEERDSVTSLRTGVVSTAIVFSLVFDVAGSPRIPSRLPH